MKILLSTSVLAIFPDGLVAKYRRLGSKEKFQGQLACWAIYLSHRAQKEGFMFSKISFGAGAPGKLWTGSKFGTLGGKRDIVDVKFFLFSCACGATSRKLLVGSGGIIQASVAEKLDLAKVPTVLVSAGGVGSIAWCDEQMKAIATWNWSGRTGGYVVANPLHVLSGRLNTPPATKEGSGVVWVRLYDGSTLSTYALVAVGPDGEISKEHLLEEVRPMRRQCPVCKSASEDERKRREGENVENIPSRMVASAAVLSKKEAVESGLCESGIEDFMKEFSLPESMSLVELSAHPKIAGMLGRGEFRELVLKKLTATAE